jgi:hypothetical protein
MIKVTAAFLFLVFVGASALGADRYKCVSRDEETGTSIVADLSLNGTKADISISTAGIPGCKSSPSLVVTGTKPVLNLSGMIVCDGDEPEQMTLVLDTAKKTLAFAETVFTCN